MAYVFSPDRENRFASRNLVLALRPHMAIELFEDRNTALAWLAELKPHEDGHPVALPPGHHQS